MNNKLSHLEPSAVWKYFEIICSIPRPSKHEAQICAYIISFAKSLELPYEQDKYGNIRIRKPACAGKEHYAPVILQAHVDMVPQKNSATQHNFLTDAIEPIIDGDWVRAKNTTLGADNGIGLAAILAVLESKTIQHGPLEALFTTDEETGMTGAFGLQPNKLKGLYMINTDTEDVHDITIGCAGGIDGMFTYSYSRVAAHAQTQAYEVTIEGLTGGHSGFEIVLNRANANMLLCDYLHKIHTKCNVDISYMQGGDMRNAIPREAKALICVPVEYHADYVAFTESYTTTLKHLYKKTDPNLSLHIKEHAKPIDVISKTDTHSLLQALSSCFNGVIAFENDDISLPRTSTNLSIITTKEHTIEVICLLRSSCFKEKQMLVNSMKTHFETYSFCSEFSGDYPEWKPIWDSPLISLIQNAYKKIANIESTPTVVHAGLECGVIQSIYPHIECISIGPIIRGPHSPNERVEITSVHSFWLVLTYVLEHFLETK
ncbi:MAG TPA: aminoacyl-histidine dipeptidase [Bacteroidales bacterium]|nr:aminoacyl-histidine dipeptidase [Bacteroidales bacterium]